MKQPSASERGRAEADIGWVAAVQAGTRVMSFEPSVPHSRRMLTGERPSQHVESLRLLPREGMSVGCDIAGILRSGSFVYWA